MLNGNADVEQSLSADEKTVTSDRASRSDVTINGLCTIKDHVKLCGEPHNVDIAKELLQATRKAHKLYGKRLSKEKEELLRKKAIQNGKTERQQEAQKLEQSRLNSKPV